MLMVVGPTCHLLSHVPMPTLPTCDRRLSTLKNYHSFFFFFSHFHDIDIDNKSSGLGTVYSNQLKSSQVKNRASPFAAPIPYASFAFLNSTLNAHTF